MNVKSVLSLKVATTNWYRVCCKDSDEFTENAIGQVHKDGGDVSV